MLIQAAQLDYEQKPVYRPKSWFDDLTLAHMAALTPPDVELKAVIESLDGVDFDADVDLVAVTTMGVSPMLRAYQISKRFRERGIPVIFGGPNFTLHADEAKKHADSVMLGEAETTWKRVLSDARRGRLEPIYDSTPLDDLSGLPVPRYDLFNSRPEFRDALFTVQASRGCPHRCDFCAISALTQGRVRFRPIDEVIRDVKATGRKRIFFADDNLMARPQYYMELFERLIPLKIHWIGATTLNIGRRPEMLKLARRSGCTLLIVGVESITQDVLNGVRKSFNHTKDYEEQIGNIHRAGIIASCSTIFGLDGDDRGVFDRTVDFYVRNKVRFAPFFILTPVPGTATWKKLKDEGRILTEDYSRYDAQSAVFKPALMTVQELESGLMHARRRMYRLGAMARRLLPPLGNPWADAMAVGMNYQYSRLLRRGAFSAFNFS
jgi:radical SAM superfamily enzyme YgiQ (UPF0313 family)